EPKCRGKNVPKTYDAVLGYRIRYGASLLFRKNMGNLERGGRQSTSLGEWIQQLQSQIMNLQGEGLLMRFGHLFSRSRTVSRWSGLLAAICMALLTLAASAQMVGSEKGKKHRDTQKTEDQAKKRKWMRGHMKTP